MALVLALIAALLLAASLRLASALSTALAAYVVLAAAMGIATWTLSPLHAVTANGLTAEEAALALAAAAVWWRRGRPFPDLAPAGGALRALAREPVAAAFVAVATAALLYELLLALTVPVTNWDSLTYHLARVAAWRQHDGIGWIANAPTARMNEFQPLAEQEILFLLVACGTTAVLALPQYAAELAILLAVYGAARRLGFSLREAACSAALLATFSLVALEATTAQNDLVAASFPAVALCLLLAGGGSEALLAGAALGLGLGAKLTTALVLPVLAWVAWSGGRPSFRRLVLGGLVGFLGVGVWGFVLNLWQTGNPLGHGQGRVENTVSPSLLGTVRTVGHLLDRLGDVSVLPGWLIAALAAGGAVAGLAVAARGRGGRRRATLTGLALAAPLLAPVVALAWTRIPAGDPSWVYDSANEDYAAFGPLGAVALVAAPLAVVATRQRRDRRQLALALALPSYLVLLALYAKYDIWITRFLLVPVVLTAPLFARFLRNRILAAATLLVAALTVGLTLAHDATKPLDGARGRPWQLNQITALDEFPAQPTGSWVAAALTAYARDVPARACVGAVLDPDEPSFLLWGPSLEHRVVFLSSLAALQEAYADGLDDVVISTGANEPVSKQFSAAGWSLRPLATYWLLATPPHAARAGPCG